MCKYLISDHVVTAEMEGEVGELSVKHISDHVVLENYFHLPYFLGSTFMIWTWLQQFSVIWF